MRNACGKHTRETIEVLAAFGEDERRAAVPYGLNDLVANRSIPGVVINQELVKRLELRPFVGRCAARRMKRSRTDEDCVLERSCGRLRLGVHPMAPGPHCMKMIG